MVSPAHGHCSSSLAPCIPEDVTPKVVCGCQMDKRQHMYLLGFHLACSLCCPPLPFGHFMPASLKTPKIEHVQTASHFHIVNFFCLLLSSSSPSLLNRQCMAPVCNNALQLCLQTNLVRIRHSWFRRCQRPQLTHNRAIRPAHCSQSHFVLALVPLSEDMSQRIKAS